MEDTMTAIMMSIMSFAGVTVVMLAVMGAIKSLKYADNLNKK